MKKLKMVRQREKDCETDRTSRSWVNFVALIIVFTKGSHTHTHRQNDFSLPDLKEKLVFLVRDVTKRR